MPALAPSRAAVRHNQTLDYDGLLAEAKAAVEGSGLSQAAVAERVSKSTAAVNFALNTAGGRYAALQRAIIEELTGFRVEPVEQVVTFRVVRK